MKKIYLFLAFCCLYGNAAVAQIPIAYYSCENSAHTGLGNSCDLSVNSLPTSSSLAVGGGMTQASATNSTGNGVHYGGSAGYAYTFYGTSGGGNQWSTATTDPTTSASTYYKFEVNTTGFSGITLTFDLMVSNGNSPQKYGVLVSSDGSSWTFVGSSTTPGSNTVPTIGSPYGTWLYPSFTLPSLANNNSTLYIRIYGYKGATGAGSGALFSVDNITVLGSTTVAGASFTTMNESTFYTDITSGSTGSQITRNSFTATGTSTNVSINNTSGITMASGQTFGVTSGATVTLGSSGAIAGTGGIFNIASGCTLATSNTSGVGGSITTTGTNVYNTGANYSFSAATATPFPTSGTWGNPANITTTSNLTLNMAVTMTGTLSLTTSKLILGSNTLTMGTSASVSGGTLSSSNLIVANSTGQVQKLFSGTGSFTYPVGDNSNYTPITLNYTAGTFAGGAYAGVNVVSSVHPTNANVNDYLNRYWQITTSGITSSTLTAAATCVPGDVTGTESHLSMGMYGSSLPWVKYSAISGNVLTASGATPSSSSYAFTGITTASPSVSVNSAAMCSGQAATLATTSSGDPGLTYSWAQSTSLSATTGSSVNSTTTSTRTYTVTITDGNGFTATATSTVTINAGTAPANITGTTTVCQGTNTLLSDAVGSGTWTSSNTSIATVDASSGFVSGVAVGAATISYSIGVCVATAAVNVGSAPASITGTTTVCPGTTTTLACATTGGTWTSGSSGIATVNSSTGVVTGVSAGTVTIYYTTSGCNPVSTSVTVSSGPSLSVTGTGCAPSASLTASGATTYSWLPGDGTLSATSGSTVTASPSAIEIYTVTGTSGGCTATATSTVYPTPANITGTLTICPSTTTTLSDATSGATWGTADGTIATVSSSGVVTGVANGTVNISYGYASCPTQTKTASVVVGVQAITTAANWGCVPLLLTESWETGVPGTAGWTCSNTSDWFQQTKTGSSTPAIPSVPDGSNVAEFNSYSIGAGSSAYLMSPVINLYGKSGASVSFWMYRDNGYNTTADQVQVSIGTSTTLSSATLLGTINRARGLSPTVSANGWYQYSFSIPGTFNTATNYLFFNGISEFGNNTYIDYIQVKYTPTATFSDVTPSGVWSSSATTVATIVSGTGVATDVAVGSTTISYSVTGCTAATTTFNVINATPAITGGTTVCASGGTLTLSDTYTGGTWSSSNTAMAVVSTSGVVTGQSTSGTVTITYDLSCGNAATYTITVIPAPSSITGTAASCSGGTGTTLSSTPTGYTWSTSDGTIASVNASGFVTPIASGTATITYSTGCGTSQTQTYTVNQTPVAITGGAASICTLSTTAAFIDATTGGTGYTWSNTPTTVGTIDAVSGIFTSTSTTGNTSISYSVSYSTGPSCSATTTLNINNTPPTSISGTLSVCTGATTALTGSPAGGTWSIATGSSTLASINSSTGVATGLVAGTAVISYSACGVLTTNVTVSGTSGSISSNTPVCTGGTVSFYPQGSLLPQELIPGQARTAFQARLPIQLYQALLPWQQGFIV